MKVADSTLQLTKALPAAGATATTDSVDLGPDGSHSRPLANGLEVHISTPALPALVEDKTVVYKVTHSADDSTFTDLLTLHAATITGGTGDGADASQYRFYLPPDCNRYIKVAATVLADGGNNTGVSFTVDFRVG